MKGKKLIVIICGIVMFIGLPLLIMPIFVPKTQLWTADYASSAVSLFISAYSLEATIALAFVIYWFQKSDSKKEHKKRLAFAKTAMGTALKSGIRWLLFPESSQYPGMATTTKDVFTEYMPELQELLSADQYGFLTKSVEVIDAAVRADEEYGKPDGKHFLRDWLRLLYYSTYFPYFECVLEEHDILNKRTFELLKCLGMEQSDFKERNIIYDLSGNPLFVKGEAYGEYTIYDNGELLFDGKLYVDDIFDKVQICDGFEKAEKYVGYYKNGKYDGQGCEFDRYGRKYREGIFCEGDLQKGIEFDWIVKKKVSKRNEKIMVYYSKYLQCGDWLNPIIEIDQEIEREGWGRFFVVDIEVDGEKEKFINIRSLKECKSEVNHDAIFETFCGMQN